LDKPFTDLSSTKQKTKIIESCSGKSQGVKPMQSAEKYLTEEKHSQVINFIRALKKVKQKSKLQQWYR
jgi:hypothetical protein